MPHSRSQGVQDLGPPLLGAAGGDGAVPLPVDGPEAHRAERWGTTGVRGGWGRGGGQNGGLGPYPARWRCACSGTGWPAPRRHHPAPACGAAGPAASRSAAPLQGGGTEQAASHVHEHTRGHVHAHAGSLTHAPYTCVTAPALSARAAGVHGHVWPLRGSTAPCVHAQGTGAHGRCSTPRCVPLCMHTPTGTCTPQPAPRACSHLPRCTWHCPRRPRPAPCPRGRAEQGQSSGPAPRGSPRPGAAGSRCVPWPPRSG